MKKGKITLLATAVIGLAGAGFGIKKYACGGITKFIGNFQSGDRKLKIEKEGTKITAIYSVGQESFLLDCNYNKKLDQLFMIGKTANIFMDLTKSISGSYFVSASIRVNDEDTDTKIVWEKEKEI